MKEIHYAHLLQCSIPISSTNKKAYTEWSVTFLKYNLFLKNKHTLLIIKAHKFWNYTHLPKNYMHMGCPGGSVS